MNEHKRTRVGGERMTTKGPRRLAGFPCFALVTASWSFVLLEHHAIAFADTFSSTTISDVAERVTPAVVNITTRKMRNATGASPFDEHPMLRDFFGRGMRRQPPPEMGAGSGVVISGDGYIVTNNHVIEGADEIRATFSDQREFEAKLIGADKPSDVALLKVQGSGLAFIKFGDSATIRLGEIVLAIGNPFGVGQTVTMGIVSAQGRANIGIIDYENFIQTDASINPGNSGGALVNLKGELIGLNTAILSKSGGAQGIGFAVPSNMVKPIRDQILQHGRVRRGWLGIAIQDLTPEIARSLNLPGVEGVLISDVMEKGPAVKANLEAGDVITKVDGAPTKTASELRNLVALLKPNSKPRLTFIRDGKSRDVVVTLDEKLEGDAAKPEGRREEQELLSGVEIQELDGDLRTRLRVPSRIVGLLVTRVDSDCPADRSGLEEGDIITAVNRRPVRSSVEIHKLVAKNAREALLRVWKRNEVFTFVVLRH